MDKLLVLADDLTGALDTGVQFSGRGIPVTVLTDYTRAPELSSCDTAVAVIDLSSRHVRPHEAADRVVQACLAAQRGGFTHYYKKTDSALRGNVGSELAALMRTFESPLLSFVPAWPANGRTTKNGRQYVNGTPLEKSAFRSDPYEPAVTSRVRDILWKTANVHCVNVPVGYPAPDDCGVHIYDCETDEQLRAVGSLLAQSGRLRFCAGCGGFAAVLADMLDLPRGQICFDSPAPGLLVVCGSMSQTAHQQAAYAAENGFARYTLDPASCDASVPLPGNVRNEILRLIAAGRNVILDLPEPAGEPSPAAAVFPARAASLLLADGLIATLLVTGGDTLASFLREARSKSIDRMRELMPGVVLSRCALPKGTISLISKAGSFGPETLFTDIAELLRRGE